MAQLKSTARIGAVSIRDKYGDLKSQAPIAPAVPVQKIGWLVRRQRELLYASHECDFAPLFDGSGIWVCACGRTQGTYDGND